MHDLQEGLPLLHLAARWLLEAIRSRQNYEAVNSYLHRFLHLHAAIIAGIEVDTKDTTAAAQNEDLPGHEKEQETRKDLIDTIADLRLAQRSAGVKLQNKMQHTMCLLRHFSRMI